MKTPLDQDLVKFLQAHPLPSSNLVNSLFKFYKFDNSNIDFIKNIFIDGKLYYAEPREFNDPFECKPHFNWPSIPKDAKALRKYLTKIAIKSGSKRKDSEKIVSKNISNTKTLRESISAAIHKTFAKLRICCFSSTNTNLLMWSHYADSHKGFCVEFDAKKQPFSVACKVEYSDKYPKAIFPRPEDFRAFKEALVKSREWEYESEYRSIFYPNAKHPMRHDGKSIYLAGDEIKAVYLGCLMNEENKLLLIDIIKNGPFNPKIFEAKLSKSEFKVEFTARRAQ